MAISRRCGTRVTNPCARDSTKKRRGLDRSPARLGRTAGAGERVNRLRSFRWIEQISQTELGELLGISTQLVSAIESGRRSATCDIAKLGYSPSRFETADMTEPLHRQRATTLVTSTRRAKELLRLAGEAFSGLQQDIPPTYKNRLKRLSPARSDTEVAECANRVRVAVLDQEEYGPIRNLTAAVERAGICLIPIVGLQGIDGISSWVERQPVIGLNIDVPGDRFRLSLAHEIGHLVLHSDKTRTSEGEAYRFASALLMHDDEFAAAMPERPVLSDFISLKSSWGISVAALVYRAHQHGHLNDRAFRSIQIQMSKWRKSEPAEFPPVYGQLLPDLVERNGGIPICADRLGLNQKHLREVTAWHRLRAL